MTALTEHLHAEHAQLRPHIEAIRINAEAVGHTSHDVLRDVTNVTLIFLLRELIPHAKRENDVLYMAVDRVLGATGASATMSRDHEEVERMTERLSTLHGSLVAGHELSEATARELRQILYGLYAIVSLHFTKEEDIYLPLLSARMSEHEQGELLQQLRHHVVSL